MWRSLSQLVLQRQATAENRGSHLSSSLMHCRMNQRFIRPTPHFTSRAFHSTIGARAHNVRRDQTFRKHAKKRYKGARRGNYFNRREDSHFDPAYVSQLEQRSKEHIQKFPEDHSSYLISHWQRTSVELIMSMSKLWGRNHRSDPSIICKFVSLANDLLAKVLLVRKNELDNNIREERNSGTSLIRSNDGHKRNILKLGESKRTLTEKQNFWREQSQPEKLTTEILCQTVALGWSRCDPIIAKDASHNAQVILDRLEDICSSVEKLDGSSKGVGFWLHDITPSIKLYNHVLSCWSRSSDFDAEARAKALLDRMSESRGTFSRPDIISYNNLLNLYANRGKVGDAEVLLERMENPDHEVSADVYSYTIVMNAFQKRFATSRPADRNMKDPERVEELLSHLVRRYENSGFRQGRLRPTNVTFGTAISMYARADRILKEDDRMSNRTRSWKAIDVAQNANKKNMGWGAANAERILDWILGLGERESRNKSIGENSAEIDKRGVFNPDNDVIRPNTTHFVTVMDAWAKAEMGVTGAQNCERLLNRLLSFYDKLGYTELRPNPMCFGAVIDAWAKADEKYETAKHAESFLDKMEELFLDMDTFNPKEMISNIAYNLVIDAWSRRSGKYVAERAENVLRRLENNYRLTNIKSLRPDVISYTAVMKAYVNHPDGGQKALKILDEMNAQYRLGNLKARPDSKALAVAMDACAKGGLTKEAERILDDVDDSKKNDVMFNTIISGYKHEGRGHEAEAILRRMVHLSEKWKLCSPDAVSYALCIEAWGNSTSQDKVSRAFELLDESIKRYQRGSSKCKPSSVTFNIVAESIANSDNPEQETTILALFERMEDIDCKPNLVSFNILIKTCASASGNPQRKRNALQIAAFAYSSLPSVGLQADSITYTSMIRAIINLMEGCPEQVRAIAGIFQQCCKEGCLNQHMINILAGAMSKESFLSITGLSSSEKTPTISSLPTEWSFRSSKDVTINNVQ